MKRLLRSVLLGLLIVVAVAGGAFGWIGWRVRQDTVTPVHAVNTDGTAGRALAVLSPGMSAFPGRILDAFEKGLVEKGWQIDATTASAQAPTDFGDYDLVVLCSPIYGGKVAPPMLDYVSRAGDFGAKKVAVVVTSAGPPAEPVAAARAMIEEQGATVASANGYAVYQPNDEAGKYEGSNTDRAVAMAHDAGAALADSLK